VGPSERQAAPMMPLQLLTALSVLISVVSGKSLSSSSASSSSSCECSFFADSGYHKNRRRLTEVTFEAADVVGEAYNRINIGSPNHKKRKGYFGDNNENLSPYCDAEQIHVTLGGTSYNSVIFSFVSSNVSLDTSSNVYVSEQESVLQNSFEVLDEIAATKNTPFNSLMVATGSRSAFSELMYIYSYLYAPAMGEPQAPASEIVSLENTSPYAYNHKTMDHWSYYRNVTKPYLGFGDYNNPYMYYDSPYIHTATLSSGLKSGTTYYYRVSGSCAIYSFTIPASNKYPMHVALTGDVGQTEVSEMSFAALEQLDPDFVLLVGDLSYADGYPKLWDSFGVMAEPFAANYPILTTGGNHEYGFGENAVSYALRWPTPYEGTGSHYFCYWGREVGVVHVIALCSYAGFTEDTLQYAWLQKYHNTNINRNRTPWIVVMMHTPFYNSNNGHWMEGELMRRSMENLLYTYGVDIVLSGHVHSYERTFAVFNNTVDECGITYFNLGDGGNYEAAYANWTYNQTTRSAPGWSAFREGSFGVGSLVILDEFSANYSWHRHACFSSSPENYHQNYSEHCSTTNDNSGQKMVTSDSFLIQKPPRESCPNRYMSTTTDSPDSDDESDDNTDDVVGDDDYVESSVSGEANTVVILSALTGVLMCSCLGVLIEISRISAKISLAKDALNKPESTSHAGEISSSEEQTI
jgi:hypothetical protein